MLHVARRLLVLALVLCFFNAIVLAIQQSSSESNNWIIMAGLIGVSALHMADAQREVLHSKKKMHFLKTAGLASLAFLFAWIVWPLNPWLVGACLATSMLLHAYIGPRVFRPILGGAQEPTRPSHTMRAMGTLTGIAFLALIPTPLGALAVPMLGVLVFWHGWRLWYNLRRIALSEGQHVDIWPTLLNDTSTSHHAWSSFKQYIVAETISRSALRAVIERVDTPDALLAYFAPAHTGVLSPAYMEQLVQERLCACDPNASMVFSMESDPREAVRILAKMRRGEQDVCETLALPDLDETSHAA